MFKTFRCVPLPRALVSIAKTGSNRSRYHDSMLPGYYSGRRLSYDGNLCTIRYIGPVQGTKGDWLGVEWDDPTRGKHNGKHGDLKYFDCASSLATPASFVRPNRPHDPRRSFVAAIRAKYASEDLKNVELARGAADAVITISGKDVEEVGFDKIRRQLANLYALRVVLLDGLCIGSQALPSVQSQGGDGAGNYHSQSTGMIATGAAETSPNIVELDLSNNLFESWQEILSIVSQLPKLSSLSVGGNRLSDLDAEQVEDSTEEPPFSTLSVFSLESCLLKWNEITRIVHSFPHLKSLAIGRNGLNQVFETPLPARLTHISLDQNMFEYLSQLQPLTKLDGLQRLNLKSNHLHDVHEHKAHRDSTTLGLVFAQSLQDLDLSYNEISSWQFIDELSSVFPGMTSLRTSGNPLYRLFEHAKSTSQNADEGYILTIARLSRLETLNFSRVTPKERLDAEAFYLSLIGKELSSDSPENAINILSRHYRYKELCERLGEPVIVRANNSADSQSSLASRLIHCTFEVDSTVAISARASPIAPKSGTWEIDVPESFTVYNILGMAGRYFGLVPMLLRFVRETGEQEDIEEYGSNSNGTRLREEVLEPRTRQLGSWVESRAAKIRIELSEDDVKLRQAALVAVSAVKSV